MAKHQTLQKYDHQIYAHFSLDIDCVIEGLKSLLHVMNFYTAGDLHKLYNTMKDRMFYGMFSILFGNLGPFETFEKFRAFFENASINGLLEFDVEEFRDGIVEFLYGRILSNAQIEELISKIKITKCITFCEVFFQILPRESGSIDGASLYKIPILKRFAGGHRNKTLRSDIESVFTKFGVVIQKTPQMILIFPENWMKNSFHAFINELVENLGFSEIEYVSDSSEDESLPISQPHLFESIKKVFSSAHSFQISKLHNFKTSAMSPEQKKLFFELLVRFCFIINNDIAIPHQNFRVHVEHFVVAFMKIIGASLEGVRVQGTIRSGPTWVHNDSKKRMVCSSVATGRNCRNHQKCDFLHSNTEHGIITTYCGKFFVVCRENANYDRTPPQKSVLSCKLKNGVVSIDSTHSVARGCSADQETHSVARGCSDEKIRYQKQMFNLMMEELNAFDNPSPVDQHAVERFSLGIPPPPESGSHTDNIVRLIESQNGDPNALLRTASTLVLAMKAKNAMN